MSGLQAAGARIRAYDPEGMDEAAKLMSDVTFCPDAYTAMEGADAFAIVTEWNAFRALDLRRAAALLKSKTMIDLRNIYDPSEVTSAGFVYHSIGRPQTLPETAGAAS